MLFEQDDPVAVLRAQIGRRLAAPLPCPIVTRRVALARALQHAAELGGVEVPPEVALVVVDGSNPRPGLDRPLRVALRWQAAFDLAGDAADPLRPAPLDEGLLRALHHLAAGALSGGPRPGRVHPVGDLDEVLRVANSPQPPLQRAEAAGEALRRAAPFWGANAEAAHLLEIAIAVRAEDLPPALAGRDREALHEPGPGGIAATATRLDQAVATAERLWGRVTSDLLAAELPLRCAPACLEASLGLPVTNTSYRAAAASIGIAVNEQQASRDLRALVEAEIILADGRTRDRVYAIRP